MARPIRASFLVTVLVAGVIPGLIPPSANPQSAPAKAASAGPITLGHAIVPIYGKWKFQIGDSPLDPATNEPLWAEPSFDDSRWGAVDLTPRPGIVDPFLGNPEWVQGWTSKRPPGILGLRVVPHPRVGKSGARREAGSGNQRGG